MKDRLLGFVIGAAVVAAALALCGFSSAQPENIGRYRLHTTGDVTRNDGTGSTSKTFLLDSANGNVWYELGGSWVRTKRPNDMAD
jgi:hypothetical protein